MTTLTKDIRSKITSALVVQKHKDELLALNAKFAALVADAYAAKYSEAVRTAMANMPEGWLIKRDSFRVAGPGRYQYLRLQGLDGDVPHRGLYSELPPNTGFYRFLAVDADGQHHPDLRLTGDLAARHEALKAELAAFLVAVGRTEERAMATLRGFTTVEKLLKEWPEVAPLAEKYVAVNVSPAGVKVPLPALRVEELNDFFGLPVGGAA